MTSRSPLTFVRLYLQLLGMQDTLELIFLSTGDGIVGGTASGAWQRKTSNKEQRRQHRGSLRVKTR